MIEMNAIFQVSKQCQDKVLYIDIFIEQQQSSHMFNSLV